MLLEEYAKLIGLALSLVAIVVSYAVVLKKRKETAEETERYRLRRLQAPEEFSSEPIEVRVPEMGPEIKELTVEKWLCEDGQRVRTAQALVELETVKISTELEAPVSGRIEIKVPRKRNVRIGELLCIIHPHDDPSNPLASGAPPELVPPA